MKAPALALVGGLMVATPALAQSDTFAREVETAESVRINHIPPFAGITLYTYLRQTWTVVTFHAVWEGTPPNRTAYWLVRRAQGRNDAAEPVVWADSRACPGAGALVQAMESDPELYMDAPGGGREDQRMGMVLDGSDVRFWTSNARIGANAAVARVEIRGNVNTPAFEWWRDAQSGLSDCWTETQPG